LQENDTEALGGGFGFVWGGGGGGGGKAL